jgi:hypothetical protein
MLIRLREFLTCILLAAFALPVFGQSTPFLNEDQIRMLRNEISGDRAFEHIRVLTQWHRDSGMEGYFKAMDYVVEAAKKNGLQDVSIIKQPLEDNYTARSAELWMVEPVELKLADIGDHAVYLADNSRDADVRAELVWAGNGSADALANLDVKGKIVLVNGNPGPAMQNAVYAKGAVGVVAYTTSESKSMLDFPDQLPWTRIGNPPAGHKGSFAFSISPRKGDTLRRVLETKGMQDDEWRSDRAEGEGRHRHRGREQEHGHRHGRGVDTRDEVQRSADHRHRTPTRGAGLRQR